MSNQKENIIHINFYCPLTVKMDDPEENDFEFVETDVSILGYHEDKIRYAVEAEIDEDMSEYFYGSEAVKNKLVSVRWDIENVRNEIFGCIHVDLNESLTNEENEELRNWIIGQCSDGWGEGFEQRPVETADGDLYISFWDSDEDWFLLDDDEFELHLNGEMQMGGYQ